jgi:hypothetical protein
LVNAAFRHDFENEGKGIFAVMRGPAACKMLEAFLDKVAKAGRMPPLGFNSDTARCREVTKAACDQMRV